MRGYLSDILLKNKLVAGVEITLLGNHTSIINCIILEEKKGKAVIAACYYGIPNALDLGAKLPKNTPVALVINGKGVLHKKLNTGTPDIPASILPGLNVNELLQKRTPLIDYDDVAIIKRKTAETIVSEFIQAGVAVVSLSLGFQAAAFIGPLLNQEEAVYALQYTLVFKTNTIRSYEVHTDDTQRNLVRPEIAVGEDYIASNLLIPYAAGLHLISAGLKEADTLGIAEINAKKEYLLHAKKLQVTGIGILSLLFVLLLANFFLYNHYAGKQNEINTQIEFSQHRNTRFDSLRKTVLQQKDFLSAAGWLKDKRLVSYFADRIGATVPDSITLTGLIIHPARSVASYNSKQWFFAQDTILVYGTCTDPNFLDAWITSVSAIERIRQAKINSYIYKKQEETGTFTAELITQ